MARCGRNPTPLHLQRPLWRSRREVLVSQEVADASSGVEVAFREIGPVELKGATGALRLHAASRPG